MLIFSSKVSIPEIVHVAYRNYYGDIWKSEVEARSKRAGDWGRGIIYLESIQDFIYI